MKMSNRSQVIAAVSKGTPYGVLGHQYGEMYRWAALEYGEEYGRVKVTVRNERPSRGPPGSDPVGEDRHGCPTVPITGA